jgi:diguanylate cyclase (GGDEF)-like protein
MTKAYFRSDVTLEGATDGGLMGDLDAVSAHLSTSLTTWVVDIDDAAAKSTLAQAAVPLIFQGGFVGFLLVRSDDPARVWADNELMLMHTVTHQLTVAVNQAHMFAQMQELALTDGLTGCYNRRSFELQLERDLHLATRIRQPLSLIMLDLDKFKQINDNAGHEAGDNALRMLAHNLTSELRAVDTAARFGGDEFAVILPQANIEGAMVVAERLRSRLGRTEIPGFGALTASFGLASYPAHASSRDTLVDAADRALFNSKRSGRNRISVASEDTSKTRLPGPAAFPAKDEKFAELMQKL